MIRKQSSLCKIMTFSRCKSAVRCWPFKQRSVASDSSSVHLILFICCFKQETLLYLWTPINNFTENLQRKYETTASSWLSSLTVNLKQTEAANLPLFKDYKIHLRKKVTPPPRRLYTHSASSPHVEGEVEDSHHFKVI